MAKQDGTFDLGDVVRSRVSAQGMVSGRCYRVVGVHVMRNFTGKYISYDLVDEVDGLALQHPVGNGHLVLEAA